jgi:hypothetical protein
MEAAVSVANDSLLYSLGLAGFPVTDNQSALLLTQATGVAVIGDAFRVTNSVSNGACVLKSSVSNESCPLVFVVNDSPNTIKVFCSPGENLGGSLNASLSIPTGQSGIFVRVPVQVQKGGGGGGTADFRAAVIP